MGTKKDFIIVCTVFSVFLIIASIKLLNYLKLRIEDIKRKANNK